MEDMIRFVKEQIEDHEHAIRCMETNPEDYDEDLLQDYKVTLCHYKMMLEVIRQRNKALEIAFNYGQIDGNHHKMWAIDQMVRALTGNRYNNWIEDYEEDGEYSWDEGIAP